MRKSRNTLFGILALTLACETTTAVPTEGAELYVPSAYKAMPAHLFSYPYAGTYLRVDYAKRRFGYPYVGSYYGNYYAPAYAYSYVPPYGITTIPCTRVIRLQQHLLPLSPLFTLSLKRLTEVYLGPTG